jgi:hypothetical protein
MPINPQQLSWPPPPSPEDEGLGLYPVDFLLETVLRIGFDWFRTNDDAPAKVFSHLNTPFLAGKYGDKKIKEIADYIKKYDIRIVQHFSLIDEQMPTISIQLLDGGEMTERAGLADHADVIDQLNAENEVLGRSEVKYSPVTDNIHIGIHTSNTPDLCKYLYYLSMYILLLFKPELEKRGLQLSTFRATDLSKVNEYLPANIYSRFINFSVFSIARIDTGAMPIIKDFVGVMAGQSDNGVETGISLADIQESTNG